jgi:UDP-N-acetylglucosamine 2-epimerase (non-hydrolysing)
MLDQVLEVFDVVPNHDLDIMQPGQSLPDLTARLLTALRDVLRQVRPDRVLVHGDTTTTMAATLAAYYEQIPVGHVEAGLRTHDIYSPWPEEVNRRMTSVIADLHFAPTPRAQQNLLDEGVPQNQIAVTGNTVIDALLQVVNHLEDDLAAKAKAGAALPTLSPDKPVVLVTGHRRENFGEGFANICTAIRDVAEAGAAQFVYPVHLNPNVQGPVRASLGECEDIHLIEPLSYLPFVALMQRSDIVLTDSGGIQEEAPALRKPVLVMRNTSERPESIEAGCAMLVGTESDAIRDALTRLLGCSATRDRMTAGGSPYGDGAAARQICAFIAESTEAPTQTLRAN